MGKTACSSDLELTAACADVAGATAKKERRMLAVTLPAEVQVSPALDLRLRIMLGCVCGNRREESRTEIRMNLEESQWHLGAKRRVRCCQRVGRG